MPTESPGKHNVLHAVSLNDTSYTCTVRGHLSELQHSKSSLIQIPKIMIFIFIGILLCIKWKILCLYTISTCTVSLIQTLNTPWSQRVRISDFLSFIPRPSPSFPSLAVWLSIASDGRAWKQGYHFIQERIRTGD